MRVQSMADRKRRHDAHVKADNSNNAAQLRIRPRAYCSVHNLRVPKWAAAARLRPVRVAVDHELTEEVRVVETSQAPMNSAAEAFREAGRWEGETGPVLDALFADARQQARRDLLDHLLDGPTPIAEDELAALSGEIPGWCLDIRGAERHAHPWSKSRGPTAGYLEPRTVG